MLVNEILERKQYERVQLATDISQIQDIIEDLSARFQSDFNVAQPIASQSKR